MWFAVALLFFCAVYAVIRRISSASPGIAAPSRPGLGALTALGLAIAAIAWVVRIDWPIGTSWLNMQFCYFAQYVVLFAVGTQAFRRGWFTLLSRQLGLGLFWGALILSPIAMAALMGALADPEAGIKAIAGGGNLASAGFALWESLFCVAMCAGVLVLFREKVNFAGTWFKRFSANSFGVYMMHMPVLVAVTLALEPYTLPPLAKFVLSWLAATVLTFALVHLGLKRIPVVKRFL
jgi:hypothetical protein